MSLRDLHDGVLKWIHEACFGRIRATHEEIGQGIHLLGTIKQMLRRRGEG